MPEKVCISEAASLNRCSEREIASAALREGVVMSSSFSSALTGSRDGSGGVRLTALTKADSRPLNCRQRARTDRTSRVAGVKRSPPVISAHGRHP
jgi:hypothetical protein